MPHLFIYGSLLFDDVWHRLVRGTYERLPATLAGHRRVALRARPYPGLVRDSEGTVTGLICLSISAGDLFRLNQFEGTEYEPIPVSVTLTDGRTLPAITYLYATRYRHRLSEKPWDPEAYRDKILARFAR